MKRFLGLITINVFLSLVVNGKTLPSEGSILNYRIIGFNIGQGKQPVKYKLEIASGNFNSDSSFKAHIISEVFGSSGKEIVEVPSFGCQYTWRVSYAGKAVAPFHHFSTGRSPRVDTNLQRLRIVQSAGEYKDEYVLPDNCAAIYDIKGNPVWYMPDTNGFTTQPADAKVTPEGTITFLLGTGEAYEIDYNGNILWQAPDSKLENGEKKIHYNHQLTRLKNGHYMVLGDETAYVLKRWPPGTPKESLIADSANKDAENDTNYQKTFFGTILEYDKHNKLVWSWRFLKYFKGSDLYYMPSRSPFIDFDMRENGFYFDEQKKVVYLSFRICSRILKIAYPSGKVLRTYGEIYHKGIPEKKNQLIYGQHACTLSPEGYLYVYNNNMRDSAFLPEVLMMQEPASDKDTLKKLWEYPCTIDNLYLNTMQFDMFKTRWHNLGIGGNAIELPDQSFFVCMGMFAKMFIVNRNKEMVWCALPEKCVGPEKTWNTITLYRAGICSRKDLEQLIWNQEGFSP